MRLIPVVFLAACAIACGSSPTSSTGSRLESTDLDERDLASAPVKARSGDDRPSDAGCYCPEVTVVCGVKGAYHARADRVSCTLELPEKACALFGFETGATASPEALMATEADRDLSADDVYELCSVKHEAQHACDRRLDSPCQSEVDAYDVSLACMRPFAADAKVAHDIEGVLAAREMNACLCGATACAACAAACKNGHPKFEATCEQAEAVYCQ